MSIDLRPLRREELTPAASVAARALRDNPINRAIFGDDPRRRLMGTDAAFRALLPMLQCPPLGAYQDSTLVGIIGVAPPGTCIPSLPRQLRMLPLLLRHGLGNLARESLVLNAWARHDPRERHWHLDPVAVEPERQGNQRYPLLFRDYLRADPRVVGAYGQIKEALARLHPHDADAYYDVKDPVCDIIVAAAELWAVETSYTPGPSDL